MTDSLAWDAILPTDIDFAVLAPSYPRTWRHGGEFIRSRVHAYVAAGLRGVVIDYSGAVGGVIRTADAATPILVTGEDELDDALTILARRGVPVLAHSPSLPLSQLLASYAGSVPIVVWYHGYEVRDYRRLSYNFTTAELAMRRATMDELNRERFDAARPLFANPDVTIVFISETQRQHSEWDVNEAAVNSHTIPNLIDGDFFRARVRQPHEAKNILLMRSFAQRNYGNDIAIEALTLLASRPGFTDLNITVRGFGRLFQHEVAPVHRLPNVRIEQRYSSSAEMALAHHEHGVFLCPSRYDTQGVMLGEAMASGMVTITNPAAAIPEFTDARSSLLPRPDDPKAFAEAIWHLVENPDLMPEYSRNASARVREQCGRAATVDRELELIRNLA